MTFSLSALTFAPLASSPFPSSSIWYLKFSKRFIYPLLELAASDAAAPTQSLTKFTFVPKSSSNFGTTT